VAYCMVASIPAAASAVPSPGLLAHYLCIC
jgi:hypothetical protein